MAISRHQAGRDPCSSGPCPAALSPAQRLQQNQQRPRGFGHFPFPTADLGSSHGTRTRFPLFPRALQTLGTKESSWEPGY